MKNKPKLSFEELFDKICQRNITFNFHSKEQVIDILKHKSYYYQLISYRKNFIFNENGYVGLDFLNLIDLSSIDSYLREYLLSLCLDVEHSVKTLLMTHITENDLEDGYEIIENFSYSHPSLCTKTIEHFKNYKYKQEMFNKREQISIWVFL